MILSFIAIDTHAQFREFFCHQLELDDSLELLNSITSQGSTLLQAHIVDGKSRLELPVEAFDGQSISAPLKQLDVNGRKFWMSRHKRQRQTTPGILN